MSATQITVKHNFETAHRLPFLGGKCENLHGHSWWAEFTIFNTGFENGIDMDGISVEYGHVKRIVRGWIDRTLDHGCMLGAKDPLFNAVMAPNTPKMDKLLGKVFIFGYPDRMTIPASYAGLPWPTVEAVAEMLCLRVQEELDAVFQGLFVDRVKLQETHINGACYIQGV